MGVDVSGQLQVAGGGEARAAVDLVYVGIALVDVAGLLAGGEVAAHEAEHGLVDGHAHGHGPLVADVAHGVQPVVQLAQPEDPAAETKASSGSRIDSDVDVMHRM